MNETKQMVMSMNQSYTEEKRKQGFMTWTFIRKGLIAWHKYHYLKYQYLAEGCINKQIKQELEGKKMHHFNKYMEIL